MSEQPSSPLPSTSGAPARAKDDVDRMPTSPQEWAAFAALPAADRAAVYLRSIRSMLMFFTVLAIVGLVGVIVTVATRAQ